jgi:tetratricopeptide (TPR) repeat protein
VRLSVVGVVGVGDGKTAGEVGRRGTETQREQSVLSRGVWTMRSKWLAVGTSVVLGFGALAGCEKNSGESAGEKPEAEQSASETAGAQVDAGSGGVESKSAGDASSGGTDGGSGESEEAELPPGTEEQQKLLAKAKTSFLKDDFEAAEPIFKKVTETGPLTGTQASAYIALGQIYVEQGEPQKAIDLLELVPEKGKEVVELRLVLARAYADAEEFREAVDEYEALLELQPNYLFAYPPLGSIYVKRGEKKKAAKLYRRYENRLHEMSTAVENPGQSKTVERLNILDIFASSNDERVVKAVTAALEDPKPRVRAKAAKTAAAIKAVGARSKLEEMAKGDSSEYVRKQAKRAAAKLAEVERPPDRERVGEEF